MDFFRGLEIEPIRIGRARIEVFVSLTRLRPFLFISASFLSFVLAAFPSHVFAQDPRPVRSPLPDRTAKSCGEAYARAIRGSLEREAWNSYRWREANSRPPRLDPFPIVMTAWVSGSILGHIGGLHPVPKAMYGVGGALYGAGLGTYKAVTDYRYDKRLLDKKLEAVRVEGALLAANTDSLREAAALLREARDWSPEKPGHAFQSLKSLSDAMSGPERHVPVGQLALALRELDREGVACLGASVLSDRDVKSYAYARLGDTHAARQLSSTIHIGSNPKAGYPIADGEISFDRFSTRVISRKGF